MAKLPTYEPQVIKTERAPFAETTNIATDTAFRENLKQSLDKLAAVTKAEANKYAAEQAVASFLDTPLHISDYEKSMVTGEDPVKKYTRGGATYNKTLRSLYGNQAKIDLLGELNLHQENVLKRVRSGELKDIQEIRAEYEAPIKGYSKVVYDIDPEQGVSFSTQATTYSKGSMKAAMKELSDQAAAELNIKVRNFADTLYRNYDQFVKNETDVNLIGEHKKLVIKNATEAFKQTSKATEHLNAFTKRIEKIERAAMGTRIAEQAFLKNIPKEQLMQNLIQNEDAGELFSNYYKGLTADQQKDLRSQIGTAYTSMKVKDSSNKSGITSKLNKAITRAENGELVDISEFDNDVASMDDEQISKFNLIDEFNSITEEAYALTPAQLQDKAEDMINTYAGESLTAYESAIKNHTTKVINTIEKKLEEDPVGFMMEHSAYKNAVAPIYIEQFGDMTEQDVAKYQQLIAERKGAIADFNTQYNVQQTMFFTKDEIKHYVNVLENADEQKMIDVFTTLNSVYSDDQYELFTQMGKVPGSEALAHIGSLILQNQDVPFDARDYKNRNARLLAEGIVLSRDSGIQYKFAPSDIESSLKTKLNVDFADDASGASTRQAIIKSAEYIYKALNKSEPATFYRNIYDEALDIASGKINGYGGVVKYNKKNILIPAYMDQDMLKNIMDNATLEDFAKHAYSGKTGMRLKSTSAYTKDQFKRASVRFQSKDMMQLFIPAQTSSGVVDRQFAIDGHIMLFHMPGIMKDLKDRGVEY